MVINNKALYKLMINKQSGDMTIPYGKDETINIAFEWVPDSTNTNSAHHQYLIVVGEVSLIGNLYTNVIIKFIIITLFMTVIILIVISYRVNCHGEICR